MNRRLFVRLVSVSALSLSMPLLYCRSKGQYNDLFHKPIFLANILEEKELREIGLAYRKLKPNEDRLNSILSILTTETGSKQISRFASDEIVESFISNKIHADFLKHEIVMVKGWVISITEARQCALFSLLPS